jgi:hypothetical protein
MQAKVDALDEELETVDRQLVVLEGLAESSDAPIEIREVSSNGEHDSRRLSGARIRAVAVPLLIRKHGFDPIHYRDWYSLFSQEGYAAAGKRPDAVFLNQVSRSPLIRSTTKAGVYVLDRTAVDRLQSQLRQQQAELAQLLGDVPGDGASLESHRKRQRKLNSEIGRIERDLREAVVALEVAGEAVGEAPQIRAA